MKGYKAFSKGMTCRGKQYAENTIFEEKEARICQRGMHFCANPLDTLDYYPLIDDNGNLTEFAEVESLDDCVTDDNKKFCTKKLKIGAKLSLSEFIKASLSITHESVKSEVNAGGDYATLVGDDFAKLVGGYREKLVGGYRAKLVGGDYATLVGGYRAKLVGGDYATLVGDNYATLVGDDYATLVGDDYATLVGDDCATLVGDDYATLVGGDCAKLVGDDYATLVGGDCAKLVGDYRAKLVGGENSIIVGDSGSIAKGKKGAVIVLVERDSNNIFNYKAVQIDGKEIKEDTFYKLENGKFVEVS